jgi:hypothetical protein
MIGKAGHAKRVGFWFVLQQEFEAFRLFPLLGAVGIWMWLTVALPVLGKWLGSLGSQVNNGLDPQLSSDGLSIAKRRLVLVVSVCVFQDSTREPRTWEGRPVENPLTEAPFS